eukprot:9488309-Pyramimonas_sp.AAC.1
MAAQSFKDAPALLYYGDFGKDPLYAKTVLTHQEYLDTERIISPWHKVDGWRLELCWHDLLHVLFLGIMRIANASCIVELLEKGFLRGANVEDKLANLTVHMSGRCNKAGHPVPRGAMTLKSLSREYKTDWPELASWFKGMHVKSMIFYLAYLSELCLDGGKRSKYRATCMWAMANFLHILDSRGRGEGEEGGGGEGEG